LTKNDTARREQRTSFFIYVNFLKWPPSAALGIRGLRFNLMQQLTSPPNRPRLDAILGGRGFD
jgi:hypothetical protein